MTPFFSRGMSGIAQCCAILALTNRKPIEEKESEMKTIEKLYNIAEHALDGFEAGCYALEYHARL